MFTISNYSFNISQHVFWIMFRNFESKYIKKVKFDVFPNLVGQKFDTDLAIL